MKTTVRDFILDNMTDQNFEKLVDMLLVDIVSLSDNEMIDKVSEYLKRQTSYTQENTFEIVNEIKKLTTNYYPTKTADELPFYDFEELNDPTPVWMPTTSKSGEKLNIEKHDHSDDDPLGSSEPLEFNDSEYTFFEQVKIDFRTKTYEDIEKNYLAPWDMNETNYQEIIYQEKNRIALGLSNFIYEVLHYTRENKLENNFEQFSNERSHVKIDIGYVYGVDYSVHFLLDHRSRYVSAERKRAYSNYYSYQDVFKVGDINYDYGEVTVEFSVEPPKFVEYEELWEHLSVGGPYILAPFTAYLNEELIVPEVSKEVLYALFEQLIYLLTYQGFNKEEQLREIIASNKDYAYNL
ncbi:hypothetical protein [Lederbergia galactosidilytica]|uniref:Uncharacterized protein n=1 Tax=Lederbergia galactosidilytica TaxID=217031 RepID=A0A177ZSS0_9BACI|nr:hypothetical protein [Lederbergia galactosidilytica]KRG12776.1 hypothetical protein ACA30_17905 [Virgibacillus soli]MBP1917023.1 hypothetical protein [Lederbergia galactosidilytica]OAK70539.1 hypothetical protein ABB05_12340 [Lederbergia galactosidilytica]